MHAGALGDLVDEFLFGAHRDPGDLGVVGRELGEDGAVGGVMAGGISST